VKSILKHVSISDDGRVTKGPKGNTDLSKPHPPKCKFLTRVGVTSYSIIWGTFDNVKYIYFSTNTCVFQKAYNNICSWSTMLPTMFGSIVYTY